ncbi:MAG: hypothetical protein GY765_00220 [bacterium]|nr:hypothetical protein [bacterium]
MEKTQVFKIFGIVGLIASVLTIFGFVTDAFSVKDILQKFNGHEASEDKSDYLTLEEAKTMEFIGDKTVDVDQENFSGPLKGYVAQSWDFDDGNLRDLKDENVLLKEEDKSNGFYLDFLDSFHNSTLTPQRQLTPPWKVEFTSRFLTNTTFKHYPELNICFTAGASTFKIHVDSLSFLVTENGKLINNSLWKYRHRNVWIDWKLSCSADGKLSIVIKGNLLFPYAFRTFEYSKPTKIEFKSPAKRTFQLDNLKIE